jgi:membrane-bound lytic murein transglycosylase B
MGALHTLSARLLFVALLLIQAPAHALDINQYPTITDFIREMVEKHDMHEAELKDLFGSVNFKPEIIEAMERPKEGLPWYEYRKLFVTEESARLGLKYWKANAEALFRANSEFGVDPEIIVAIIGVETRYGKNTGGYRILDALTTLTAGYPARSDFFRKELEEFLLLMEELGVDPFSIKGSYAGAMGVPQFMPSSYRRYAVDFDGDHRRNIIQSADDAIGSVANYFREHGWKKDQPVIDRIEVKGTLYGWLENNGNEPELTIKQLKKYGVIPVPGIDLKQLASLITLEEEAGPMHHLAYNNFYVITRYNRSRRYAMAVYELSRMLHKLYYEDEL